MLVMLCTRCHQREATLRGPSAETRAKCQAMFGVQWPYPDDICVECASGLFKDPEFRARFDEFMKGLKAYNDKQWRETIERARSGVLRVLDFADELVGKQ